jgi:hypothetical protein
VGSHPAGVRLAQHPLGRARWLRDKLLEFREKLSRPQYGLKGTKSFLFFSKKTALSFFKKETKNFHSLDPPLGLACARPDVLRWA